MKRTVKDNRDLPHPKPVERVVLSEQKTRLRFALLILLILVAVGAFVYGIMQWLGKEDGWTTIEVNSAAEVNCGSEFIFQYYLGASGLSAAAENKLVSESYTDACVNAYQLFNSKEIGAIHNVGYINSHPNEEIEVDDALYRAFEICATYRNRNLYLGPAYELYDSLFYCEDDWETVSFDPMQNEELKQFFTEVASYAVSPDKVDVQLLGNNRIMLYVSEDYLKYAEEEYISCFVDFYWMKNAFIADYIADRMIANGYTKGSISSYDGFVRNFDSSDEISYSFNLYDRLENYVYQAGCMEYTGQMSIVYLRNYPMNSLDFQHYYELGDGSIRTPYLDTEDGVCKSALNNLVCYSKTAGCAEILMEMIPVYIADEFEEKLLPDTEDDNVYSIYFEGNELRFNEEALKLSGVDTNKVLAFFG
ncbi:MAG: hypothetical protein ACI4AB_04995 [Acetatifactor sp.]